MKFKNSIFYLLILLFVISFSCKDNSVDSSVPSSKLEDVFSQAAQNPNLKCLIVFQGDHIIKEKYFHTGDSSKAHDVRSVTKSIMATLIGIAIDKGYIPSENQKIGDYLRAYFSTIDSNKANIKIRDLLSMSSGISGNDLANVAEYTNWFNAADQIIYTLNRPMDSQAGEAFEYNSGAAHLTSAVLTRAVEITTFQFAKQFLFQPLGIADHYWQTDKRGIYNGAAGLTLTPHDMLKIGQLYLNRGVYNGTRIVSEEWIKKASSFKITTDGIEPFAVSYGFFWWIGSIHSHDYFFANGWGGQFIVITPDLRLIVIATNEWSTVSTSTANQQWYSTLDLIINKIIPLYE